MKKILLLTITIMCCVSFGAKAQMQSLSCSYLKASFAQPLGEYKDYYKSGFGLDYGRIFALDIDIANGAVVPGIDITFVSTQFNFGKDHNYFDSEILNSLTSNLTTRGGLLWSLGVKLGPSITVGITDGLVADFAIQYDPTVIFSFARKGIDKDKWDNGNRVDDKSSSSVSFANRIGFKGGVRYQHFFFGLEFLIGSTNISYSKAILPELTNAGIEFTKEKDMGLGTMLLNFGFTF
jgi:hypothetical protein